MDVTLVEIKQDLPGFDSFFGSWVIMGDVNIVIDVGPANTAAGLIDSLTSLGLENVDYVLLTHIHLDHSGALADVLDHYPTAQAICHEKAVKYLIDPSPLWSGSLKVLGKIAEMYGRPDAVPEEKLVPHGESDVEGLQVIETPGHAVHHLSFTYRDRLFAGEAGGVYLHIENEEYLRPSTPPRFFFDDALKSVDLLLGLKDQPIYFAHLAMSDGSHRLLKTARDQLVLWKELIYGIAADEGMDDAEISERCIDVLLKKDTNLKAFHKMDPDSQKREKFFMANAVKGFLGSFRENR